MTIDWSKPLVTNAGKPARVVEGPDAEGDRSVSALWFDGKPLRVYYVRPCGEMRFDPRKSVRNATPAEILAHPSEWPEWQDWARAKSVTSGTPIAGSGSVSSEPPTPWQFYRMDKDGHAVWVGPPKPQPEGVFVTRARLSDALRDAILLGSVSADTIADALGIPPDKPKPAPWEAAYEAWYADKREWDCLPPVDVARWAVEWCVGQIEKQQPPGSRSHILDFAREAIMGDDA